MFLPSFSARATAASLFFSRKDSTSSPSLYAPVRKPMAPVICLKKDGFNSLFFRSSSLSPAKAPTCLNGGPSVSEGGRGGSEQAAENGGALLVGIELEGCCNGNPGHGVDVDGMFKGAAAVGGMFKEAAAKRGMFNGAAAVKL
jgi:hypothetical protein